MIFLLDYCLLLFVIIMLCFYLLTIDSFKVLARQIYFKNLIMTVGSLVKRSHLALINFAFSGFVEKRLKKRSHLHKRFKQIARKPDNNVSINRI